MNDIQSETHKVIQDKLRLEKVANCMNDMDLLNAKLLMFVALAFGFFWMVLVENGEIIHISVIVVTEILPMLLALVSVSNTGVRMDRISKGVYGKSSRDFLEIRYAVYKLAMQGRLP